MDFIYEAMKDCEEFKILIEKHTIDDLIIYKVLVPIEIIGRNKFLDNKDREDIQKRYDIKDLNMLDQHAMNKRVTDIERKIKTNFLENFSIFGFFDSGINISESIFYKLCSFKGFIESKGSLIANNCDFKSYVDFRIKARNKSLNNASFENSIFRKEVTFSNIKFLGNTNFNNSHFKDYVDFHECEFEKTACFYGVKFYKAPNFSACYFKEQKAVNLINVDIDELNFESVEKYIEDNYQDESYENKIKGMQNEKEIFKIQNKHKLRYAKNLKDSFRVIKDILITQNNTLEAQEWHKLELYAKEKENHINLSVKDREKNADISKNILIWFNCVLLNVYRNTSDHHNDFLKILNFTVGMIVLYGVFIFFCQACIEPYSKFFNELKSSVIFIIIGILVFLCCIMFYFNRKKAFLQNQYFLLLLWCL